LGIFNQFLHTYDTILFTLDYNFLRVTACYSAYVYDIARPSVCPSVRWVDHTKTVEVTIMKFSSYGSPSV